MIARLLSAASGRKLLPAMLLAAVSLALPAGVAAQGLPLQLDPPSGAIPGRSPSYGSSPPAAVERPYDDYCRNRGADCGRSYNRESGDFQSQEGLRALDEHRAREQQIIVAPPQPQGR